MVVASDGSFVGSLSGGCIERAVVSEALDVLKTSEPRIVRFGEGSPYFDIKLPCGGGLDVHFMPLQQNEISSRCLQAVNARKPFAISLPKKNGIPQFDDQISKPGVSFEETFIKVDHEPNPNLLLIGHGAVTSSLARLSREMLFDVQILTSDEILKEDLTADGFNAVL